jgi:hypothetical protein
MEKRALVVMCLVAVGGCFGGADGGDVPRGVPAASDIEAKQRALGPVTCAHSPCVQGGPLTAGCGPNDCVAWICSSDPYCCNNAWIKRCVDAIGSVCQMRCNCDKICTAGNAYYPDACDCTAQVFGVDSYCGLHGWDAQCIAEANSLCGVGCP